jgi:hypothetical protein
MAAWEHSRYWNQGAMAQYREYVEAEAPRRKGRTEDCANLSLTLLIDFAAENQLPVTFRDNNLVLYCSKGSCQYPDDSVKNRTWRNKDDFMKVISARIGSPNLAINTFEVKNLQDIWPGDLMWKWNPVTKERHTAIIFNVLQSGRRHPKQLDSTIPDFPGPKVAAQQANVLEYFATQRTLGPVFACSPKSLMEVHIDYLNHRGEGTPKKEKAELIYFRSASELQGEGFEFRRYTGGVNGVLDNWERWNGEGTPIH